MKKLLLVVLLAVTICGTAFGADQITADEAFVIASKPTDDSIVGVWRMHPRSGGHSKIAHMAIVPNTTNRRQNWSYLGIMLEDGFQLKKNGIKIALRRTRFKNTYDVILSNTVSNSGAVYIDGGGFAFLNGKFLNMNRVEVPYSETIFDRDIYRYAPITHMAKVRNFQIETAGFKFTLSGLTFDGPKIKSVEPGSFADKAGLSEGDMVLEVNGRSADEKTLKNIDTRLAAGRSVMILYERGGNKDMVTLK